MELQICSCGFKIANYLMKILITGATGFIGNHLINKLLEDDVFSIVATSRSLKKAQKMKWFNHVDYISYDFDDLNDENLYEKFGRPDKVIHLAWDGLPDYNNLIHIEKNLFNNYNFIKNMVKNGLKDITIVGTCLEYGIQNGCLSEEMNINPSNAYAIAKDTLRKFIIELQKELKFEYKWIRLFYMYGEGQSEKSLMSLLDKAIADGDEEFNMSGGEQLRDFLPIGEVVSNIVLIMTQKLYMNQAINCCKGQPISVRTLVENYLNDRNSNIKLNLGFYEYPNYEPMAFWGDNSKLKNLVSGSINE